MPRKGSGQGPRASSKGNVEAGLRQADAVVEATYTTQVQTHTALEPHGLVARWEGDELTVWASTQGIFSVRDELAEVLGIPASKVNVITEYMGGGFGAKFGARVEGVTAAKLAKEAGAPVKLFLDRKEEHLATGNRPSAVQWIKAGATKDGKLTALHLIVHGTGGTGTKPTVTSHRDGSAQVIHGLQDLGTGARTMVGIVAAEELHLPLEKVSVRIGDTRMPYGPGSGGSTTTPSSAPAVRAAAYQACRKLAGLVAADWGAPEADVLLTESQFATRDGARRIAWKDACARLGAEGLSATAERAENHDDAWKHFTAGAQVADGEVAT